MPPIFQKLNFCYTLICTCSCSLFLGIGCSKLERVNEQDVEYRKDKKGNRFFSKLEVLSLLGRVVSDRFPEMRTGRSGLRLDLSTGLSTGLLFRQTNGLKPSGSYEKGKGWHLDCLWKGGELVYEKSYLNDELTEILHLLSDVPSFSGTQKCVKRTMSLWRNSR